jgi:hypothetical protein
LGGGVLEQNMLERALAMENKALSQFTHAVAIEESVRNHLREIVN